MININLKKVITLIGAGVVLLSAGKMITHFTKKSDCNINEYHLHKYQKGCITRYIADEHMNKNGYKWTNEIKYVDEEDKELYEFEKKNNLIRIDDNIEYLNEENKKNKDYIEYEYRYTSYTPVGKTVVARTRYNWTTDANDSRLTGKKRLCHYLYKGYKIERNDNGKYVLVESDYVDDILSIKDEYPYFKKNYFTIEERELENIEQISNNEEDKSKTLRKINNRI